MTDRLLDACDMALLIKKSVLTLKRDVNRCPDSLPPRTIRPGSKKLLWRQSDFDKWIASLPTASEATKRGPGRPPICQQIADKKRQDDTSSATNDETLQHEVKPRGKGGRPRKAVKANQIAAGRG